MIQKHVVYFTNALKQSTKEVSVQEQRRHARNPVRLSIVVQGPNGERTEAICSNLGVGGMFMQLPVTYPFGTELTIEMTLAGLAETALLPSVVRWQKPDGLGVQFGLIGARETRAILEYIARNSVPEL